MSNTSLTPVLVLTGFLGAGKTTLLKRLLSEPQSHRWVIIENEFGPLNIDHDLLVESTQERIVELSNGCLCCSIRGDLSKTLLDLAEQKQSGKLQFDRVIIETTGIAKPGPIIQTFFMDDAVVEKYMLDGVITIVDAKHGMATLDKQVEAQQQVGVADRILISKSDLVSQEELSTLKHRLHHINPRATLLISNFGEVDLSHVLDLKGFHMSEDLSLNTQETHDDHHHHHGEDCNHCSHDHHDEVSSFAFESKDPFDPKRLDEFLSALVQLHGESLLRYKGVLYLKGIPKRVIFQGVHMLMASDLGSEWGENKQTRMVFIGNRLPKETIHTGLKACIVR
jgi:G3E family GTPase